VAAAVGVTVVTVDASGSGIVPSKYPCALWTSAARVIIILSVFSVQPVIFPERWSAILRCPTCFKVIWVCQMILSR